MQVGSEQIWDEKVQCMLAQVESSDLPAGLQQGSIDPEDILQKLDVSGIDDWDPQCKKKSKI